MSTSHFTKWFAFQKGELLAQAIFDTTLTFPREEHYSLTDQIRRSSRSVCANLAEAFGKRYYPKHFRSKLSDSIAENYETQVWIRFAKLSGYLTSPTYLARQRRLENCSPTCAKTHTNSPERPTNLPATCHLLNVQFPHWPTTQKRTSWPRRCFRAARAFRRRTVPRPRCRRRSSFRRALLRR
ncbi:four helix bundle protein [Lewinella sp. W8]|uniref:four helix bundle protein n=1 Tax=Lewinella sp. W8 TaxID=2528208 RepID=UPI0020A686F6|nr:four helix bundle protein [Lewinella sp. W8]